MDKLRSLQYFIAAAEGGSFSAAARRMEVTIPAVAKLVNALEESLGVRLFERSAQGLVLTAVGESYLECCLPAVSALQDVDEQVRGSALRARGTVVVGIQHVVAHALLAPALPRFHARHPEIQIDLRESTQSVDTSAPGVDVYISLGWPEVPDMIHRALAVSRFVVCAAPGYWAAHGVPRHPRDLEKHPCLLIRTQKGTVMDLWNFRKGDVNEAVTVKGWLMVNNAHRDTVVRIARGGECVMRILDWSNREDLASGALMPVLTDWEQPDAPPVNLSYRPSARRIARVRLFIDFVLEVFRELERNSAAAIRVGSPPQWARGASKRASTLASRSKR